MALTEAIINFNYKVAISKAEELESAAGELETEAVNELGTIITAIKRDWEGHNSDEYTAKCLKEQGKLQDIADDMRSVASKIRTMAENIRKAEMKALEIAKAAAAAAAAAAKNK